MSNDFRFASIMGFLYYRSLVRDNLNLWGDDLTNKYEIGKRILGGVSRVRSPNKGTGKDGPADKRSPLFSNL